MSDSRATTAPDVVREWRPDWPCSHYSIAVVHKRGAGDPTFQLSPQGVIWRACRTPDGPVTARIERLRRPGEYGTVLFEAWGSGAAWWCAHGPAFLGAEDEIADFRPSIPSVARVWSLDPSWRISRTHLVLEALVAAAIEQKVVGREARFGWRALLRRFGDVAPGPGVALGMRVLPTPERLATIPSWDWLRCHIDGARSGAIVRAAARSSALERTLAMTSDTADRALQSISGVGVWTSAEVRQRAHGDSDAVSFGDFHIAAHVTHALTGSKGDDDEMRELLEPERPHRYRIQHLVTTRMAGPERRGPRMAPRTHLPARAR